MIWKKNFLILSIILVLTVIAKPIPVKATVPNPVSGQVNLVFRYPSGLNYYPAGTTNFTLDIQSPAAWTDTPNGIIAYTFTVTVNGSLLKPLGVTGAKPGYWLWDFCNTYNNITAHYPLMAHGAINSTTIPGIAEGISGWSVLGVGAGGNSSADANGLITLNFAPLGQQQLTLRPAAEGYNTAWSQFGASANKAAATSDQNDATGINATAANKKETFTFAPPSNANGTIQSVNFYMRAYHNGTKATSIYPLFYFPETGDTLTASPVSLTSTDTTYSQTYTTNPDTGAAWTWSDLTDLQYGVETAIGAKAPGTSLVSDIWCVVTYLPENVASQYVPIRISNAGYFTVAGGANSGYAFNHVAVGNYGGVYPPPVDVAVSGIQVSKTLVEAGQILYVNVTVGNYGYGSFTEKFNVTAYANTTILQTQTVTLTTGKSTTLTFTWNTTGFAYGNYVISAYATPVPAETNLADNTYIGGNVFVTIPGDFNGDGNVNSSDFVIFLASYTATAGQPAYNANCDINGDGKVNSTDFVIFLANYGKSI
jgi:hypothetical protein